MTKNRFLLGALAIALVFGMVFSGCKTESDDDDSGGTLTITGLSEYNNNYAAVTGSLVDDKTIKIGFGKHLDSGVYDMPKISGGRVTLPVWKKDEAAGDTRYGGDDRVSLTLYISPQPNNKWEVRIKDGSTIKDVTFLPGGRLTVDADQFDLQDCH